MAGLPPFFDVLTIIALQIHSYKMDSNQIRVNKRVDIEWGKAKQ